MNYRPPFKKESAKGSELPPSSETAIKCPLPAEPMGIDELSRDLCNSLDEAGCPVGSVIERRLRFEALLSELSATFVNVPANKVDSQIESGLRLLVELLGLDRAGLGEISADGKEFVVTHSYQLPGVPSSSKLSLFSQFPTYARMISQGIVVRLPDDMPPQAAQEREYFLRTGLKSNLTIPLIMTGTVVGGIGFTSHRSNFRLADELIPRLRLAGDIFSNALARKRADEAICVMDQSLRQGQERLRRLAGKLLHAQEEERRRIAREMHDDWTQRLAILGIDAAKLEAHLGASEEALPLVSAIREQLVSLSEDVHALSRQLHPSILDDLGLVEALRSECASFSRREEIAINFLPDNLLENVPPDVALCVYRVAQESLRNVARHAAVKEASVKLVVVGPELVIQICDQGTGFDREMTRSEPGLGLSGMEERVRLVQGKLSIISAPGQGTTVEVRVSLSNNSP